MQPAEPTTEIDDGARRNPGYGRPWRVPAAPPIALEHRTYVPLREADIDLIRRYRNDQIEVLRQREPLAPADQERWFTERVRPTFTLDAPGELLVSILVDDGSTLAGYGGLTNIAWPNRRAELSFLVAPDRAATSSVYREDLLAFVAFIRDWAFGGLGLNRIFTETYAFRTDHIAILEDAGFVREGVLRQHTLGPNGFVDSVMHGMLSVDFTSSG